MASTYVNDLRLNEMATGDGSGTWGTTTNTNLELIAEAFSYGTEAITTNADTHTTTIADGASDPGRALYLKYTGTLDSACTITIGPDTVSKVWIIENGTSGSQNIIISQGSGANITIPAGDTKVVYSDGAGAGAAFVDAFASLSVVDLKVQDDLTVTDDASIGGDATITGTLGVTGNITGTLATAAQPNITSLGTLTGLTTTGDINFGDDDKAIFGAGSDLQIYHDGSNSIIKDAGTGNLEIQAANLRIKNPSETKSYLNGDDGGAITVFYDGSQKLATTATGIDVTGTATMDGLTVDGVATITGTNLTINSSASTPYIGFSENGTTGLLIGESSIIGAGGGYDIYAAAGQGLTFFTNASRAVDIDTAGNVSIGTSSPNQDGFGAESRVLTVKAPTSGGTGALELIGLANSSGDLMSAINFMSYAVTNPAARITALRHTADDEASIAFDTSGAERLRIDKSGYILAGTTSNAAGKKVGQIVAASGIITTEAAITTTNGTVDVTVPAGGIMITAQSGYSEDAAIFTFKADGGSQGVFGTGIGNSNWAFGTTSEPGGAQRNKVWVQAANTLRFKDNGYGARTYQLTILSNTA
jgi:hypothetical protein